MQVTATSIAEVKIIEPRRLVDDRGFFSETYSERALAAVGITTRFMQDNHASSLQAGTLRGLHYQIHPRAQDKLVRVVRGKVLDVAVDIRRSSPTFGQHAMVELSAENWRQLYIPAGFAHGYLTLEPDTEVVYKVSDYYSPGHERGILWNDPNLAIPWPLNVAEVRLSEKDRSLPRLSNAEIFD